MKIGNRKTTVLGLAILVAAPVMALAYCPCSLHTETAEAAVGAEEAESAGCCRLTGHTAQDDVGVGVHDGEASCDAHACPCGTETFYALTIQQRSSEDTHAASVALATATDWGLAANHGADAPSHTDLMPAPASPQALYCVFLC